MDKFFSAGLVSGELLYKKVVDVLSKGNPDAQITQYTGFEVMSESDFKTLDLLIIDLTSVNTAREILSHKNKIHKKVSIVFIYPEELLSISDYKDLIINGAFGLVPDTNIKALLQHIHRIEDLLSKSSVADPHFFDEIFGNYFDSSESSVSLINSDMKYESVNESFRKLHNLDSKVMKGTCPSKLWGEDVFKTKIEANIKKCLKGKIIKYKTYFDKNEAGGRCYEVIYRPFKPKGSQKQYSLVETRDISHIEDAIQEAVQESTRNFYYEKYLPFGIFECDKEGRMLNANETFYDILEIPEKKRDNIHIKGFTQNDNRFVNYLETVHEGESTTFSQLQMVTDSGSEIYTRISSHARVDSQGELIINATLEDNTREVLLERKLNQTHRIETLGTLAGGIAHDFNTILTTITGYSELTMDEVDSASPAYDYMTRLLHSVNRAENIVNQMLTFSKQIDVEMVPVAIESIVDGVCDFMQSALPFNIVLDRKIEEIGGQVKADPTQLFRVFLNVLTNSMQAMEGKGGRILVTVSNVNTNNKPSAEIVVSDSGSGIDKVILERIYEPFFTTKNPGEGTGMGLAVVHGIITAMGGEINVDSTPGEGTDFKIKVPVYSEAELSGINESDEQYIGTILYADNNIHFSRNVSLALERLGYSVRLASEIEDIESYMNDNEGDNDIIFIRCTFESTNKEKVINRIIEERPGSRIVLITDPGANNYRSMIRKEINRISILNEPVTLREIVNSIQNRC